MRYVDEHAYFQVIAYIENSVFRLNQAKIEHERLEREKQEAVTKQLEAEARLQRESAERAEKEKLQTQAFAMASRRRSIIVVVLAVVFAVGAIVFAFSLIESRRHEEEQKIRNNFFDAKMREELQN